MSEPRVNVEGLGNLVRTLKRAGAEIGDLKEAHAAASRTVAAAASSSAPRRTGALAGTIRGTRQKTRARVTAGRASVPYAAPIHWGWPARGIAAQPFISEAAQATESSWVEAYRRAVVAAVAKVKGV